MRVRPIDMVSQTKINYQPHSVFKSSSGNCVSILIDEVIDIRDVFKDWVKDRITCSIKGQGQDHMLDQEHGDRRGLAHGRGLASIPRH